MIPLSLAKNGEENTIKKIGGNAETKKHLEDLGFNTGSPITVITSLSGNMIVDVKGSRIAINTELAGKIMI